MNEAIFLALLPIVLLIALGFALRRRSFVTDAFWPQAERLCYFVLLPCLFFHGLATADISDLPVHMLALTLILATVLAAGLVVAARSLMPFDGPQFTSIFQGGIRFNNYVGVTLAAGLFGANGIALAAVCNAAIVPTVNILCVLVFAKYGSAKLTARSIALQLVTNPLVVASIGGIIFQWLSLGIPAAFEPALQTLGAASLPLGLLCVGAALEFGSVRQWLSPIAVASICKFGLVPLATLAIALVLGLSGEALTIALLFQALPTASSSYIMARQLGGDAPLMAAITVTQTMMAMLAMPAMLIALSHWHSR